MRRAGLVIILSVVFVSALAVLALLSYYRPVTIGDQDDVPVGPDLPPAGSGKVTDFDSCVAEGNPVMESYPRKCRSGEQLFVEKIDNIGESCDTDEGCRIPMEFAVQSNCPFGAACIGSRCKVVCPLTSHSLDPQARTSYVHTCDTGSDCDCGERGDRTLSCVCHDSRCLSVEAE